MDTDPKSIHQLEFVGKLKKLVNDGNTTDAGNDQIMFVLTILEEIETETLSRKCTSFMEDGNLWGSKS